MLPTALLTDFDATRPALVDAAERLRTELAALLSPHEHHVHQLTHRIKSRESLRHKLARPDKTYARLEDVTDLVAFRVTVYFEDAIDRIAGLIEQRFVVDYAHSADKLRARDQVRFGYRSLHYVCRIPAAESPATSLSSEMRFEIQLRSSLQHAWAEVEHDLGYKASETMPERVRRRFSRVAGLLEIADQEFVSIRQELERYAAEVQAARVDRGASFSLDAVSLAGVVESPTVRGIDERIAQALGKPLGTGLFHPAYLLKMLRLAGIESTRGLHDALDRHADRMLEMVPRYFDFSSRRWSLTAGSIAEVDRGYSLFFLSHAVVLTAGELGISKVGKLADFYRELDYPNDERAAQELASALIAALA